MTDKLSTPDELPHGLRTDLALAAASTAMSLAALILLVIG
jgi:hypothetical protein